MCYFYLNVAKTDNATSRKRGSFYNSVQQFVFSYQNPLACKVINSKEGNATF